MGLNETNIGHSELYYKKIRDSLLMYHTGIWGPILIPEIGSPGILTGIDAYKKLSEQRQLVRARYVITGSCNLRCYHCYAHENYNNYGVSTENTKKIIDEIAKAGTFFLQLDGGEVGCRTDLSEIINHATDRGLIMEFFTNGTLFDDKFFNETIFDNVYAVVFSIHSHIDVLHDKLTNSPGSFDKAILNILRLKDKVRKVVIKMTITKKNIESLPGLYNLSQQLGVGFGYDIDILPSMDKKDLLQIDENDVRWMKKTCPYIFTKGFSRRMCIGGTCGCTIDQDGNLFPCRLSNLKIGNVLETPLIELWNSDIARDVGNTIFNQPSQCYSCKELHQFCFYCPMKAFINNIKQDQWVEYNCSLARRREILYHGN